VANFASACKYLPVCLKIVLC